MRGQPAIEYQGRLTDSRLIAKKLSDHRRILCASPDYVKLHGMPETPRDLATHNCLGFTRLAPFPDWRLSYRDRKETVTASGSLISNDSDALLSAARAGVGILGAGEWLMSRDIEAGTLARVLPEWILDSQGGVFLFVPPSGSRRQRRKRSLSGSAPNFRLDPRGVYCRPESPCPWIRRA